MLTARTTARTLIDGVMGDMGLYTKFERAVYREILNETIARLYNEVIEEIAEARGVSVDGALILSDIPVPKDVAPIREADVLGVRKGDTHFRRVSPKLFGFLDSEDGSFYALQEEKIRLTPTWTTHGLFVTYRVRPLPFTKDNEERALPVPDEYVSLLRAKIRGEIYKLANEDELAAKWLGEYNLTLASFAAFCAARRDRI